MNDPLNDAPSGLAIPQALPPASGLDQYLRLADAYLQARRRGQDFSLESFFNGGMGNDVARGQPLQPSPAAPAGGGEAVSFAPDAGAVPPAGDSTEAFLKSQGIGVPGGGVQPSEVTGVPFKPMIDIPEDASALEAAKAVGKFALNQAPDPMKQAPAEVAAGFLPMTGAVRTVASGFKTKKAAANALKELGPGHSIVNDGNTLSIVSDGAPELRASTRFPTGKTSPEDPIKQQLSIGLEEMKKDPTFEHNVGLLSSYPGFAHLKGIGAEEAANSYIDQARGNLNFLYENSPQIIKDRSPHWYDGANRISDAFAQKYGIPRQSASAAIAALSPQMDWFKNASLAERVGDVMFTPVSRTMMTPQMAAYAKASPALSSPANAAIFSSIQGKKFSDLKDPFEQAMWIRLYDEAHNPRAYRTITPEGEFGDFITTGKGEPAKIGWGSLNEIAKAVQAFGSGGDMNVISPILGTKHKVRSFYNNIESPNDPRFGDVTIDTHQVAAGQLRPLSGNTPAVAHNLASGLAKQHQPEGYQAEKSSAISGVQGTYGLLADATRKAAADQGLLPRAMQSATWEPVRELFPAELKRSNLASKIDDIWRAYDAKQIGLNEARKAIFEAAGGIGAPDWAKPGLTSFDPRRGSSYR